MHKPQAVYLIGGPGVGKSTIMGKLMLGWQPVDHIRVCGRLTGHPLIDSDGSPSGLYLGKLRDLHPGTDALSMSVHPHAVAFAEQLQHRTGALQMIFGEGARLGTIGFLTKLDQATDLSIIHLVADPDVTKQRRALRHTKQNSSWVTGATTRALHTAVGCAKAGCHVAKIDTNQPIDHTVAAIQAAIDRTDIPKIDPMVVRCRT